MRRKGLCIPIAHNTESLSYNKQHDEVFQTNTETKRTRTDHIYNYVRRSAKRSRRHLNTNGMRTEPKHSLFYFTDIKNACTLTAQYDKDEASLIYFKAETIHGRSRQKECVNECAMYSVNILSQYGNVSNAKIIKDISWLSKGDFLNEIEIEIYLCRQHVAMKSLLISDSFLRSAELTC